jgi:mannitol/fructose-specific phosphotransferase system IIA component (Ntr-type)
MPIKSSMTLSRCFNEKMVKLEMTTQIDPPEEGTLIEKWRQQGKEHILSELVDLLQQGSRVGNPKKLLLDFINREKKATTGIGYGVAIPHIRSVQAKDFMIGFARSTQGYDFGALDDKPTHLFFVMAAPPYDDSLYLRVFKSLSGMLQYESFREELMTITSPGELIRVVRAME